MQPGQKRSRMGSKIAFIVASPEEISLTNVSEFHSCDHANGAGHVIGLVSLLKIRWLVAVWRCVANSPQELPGILPLEVLQCSIHHVSVVAQIDSALIFTFKKYYLSAAKLLCLCCCAGSL